MKILKGITKITPECAYIIGVLLGDGNQEKYRIRFGVKDKDFILKIKKDLEIWTKSSLKIKKKKNNKSYLYYINFNSVYLSSKIPEIITKIKNSKNNKINANFIAGSFDSEGSVDKNRKRIRFAVKSKFYSRLVSKKLKQLKIVHTFNFQKLYGFYWIKIYKEHIFKFHELIHFSINRKEQRVINHLKKTNELKALYQKRTQQSKLLCQKEWSDIFQLSKPQYARYKRNEIQ